MKIYHENQKETEEILPGDGIAFTDSAILNENKQCVGHVVTITNADKPSLKDTELAALCNVVGSLVFLMFGFHTVAVVLNLASLYFIIKAMREIK